MKVVSFSLMAIIATLSITGLSDAESSAATGTEHRSLRAEGGKHGLKIMGGTETPVGKRTYVAGIRQSISGMNFCGGSLITPKHVLTAAHCMGNINYVSIGSHYNTGTADGVQIAVVKQTPHPQYDSDVQDYDFLILELASPVSPTVASPVALTFQNLPLRTPATVAGWGAIYSGGPLSPVLLQTTVEIVSNDVCRRYYEWSSSKLCAGTATGGKDACQGDSGGPLTVPSGTRDLLIGTVSIGIGCGQAEYPGVYGRIAAATTWIKSVLSASGYSATWV